MQAFLNPPGAFIDLDAARISALDAGFQHAVGLFETMLGGVKNGEPWVIALDEHTERLAASAAALDLSPDLRAGGLADAVLATVSRSGLERARIKLTVTGGDLNMLARPAAGGAATQPVDPTILITATPATVYPPAMLATGVVAALAGARANNFNPTEGHKTLAYWWRLRELQSAGRKGAAEAFVFDATNHLAGGCVSNAFIVKSGTVFTPIARGEEGYGPQGPTGDVEEKPAPPSGNHLPSPVLPGITRAWAIDQLALKGVTVERRMLTIDDVLNADELFLTNSSWGVLPVVQLEAKPIAQRTPGPITAGLVDAWRTWTSNN